jgi:Putative auto-transporter adhesin, head GIN domain
MNKRLVAIAVVSLSVSAACALLVVLTSATDWVDGDYLSWAATKRTCAATPWAKKASPGEPRTIDLEWGRSDAVKVNIPARVHYQPGPQPQASVSGDAELVSHVRMRDGALEWDTTDDCFPADDLVVRLTGPAVTAWTLNSSGDLQLADIKQDTLRIAVHGSGAVTASGEVHEVSLHATGSGRADLGRLVTQQVSARISGSGEADLAPREEADISISGSGGVRLHGAVARIHSHVSGSGQIKQVP